MPQKSCLVVVCGQQRSGTTALDGALGDVDGIRNFGEVFQYSEQKADTLKHNFFYYVKHVLGVWQPIATVDEADASMDGYFDYLHSLTVGSFHIADIKYNHWYHFAPGWLNLMGCPFMLQYLKRNNALIVHVVRRNLVLQYVSAVFAEKTGKWHYAAKPKAPHTMPTVSPFDIKIADLEAYLELVQGNISLFRKYLRGYPNAIELCYEEMMDGTLLSVKTKSALQAILPNRVLESAKSPFVKSTLKQVDWILNRNAIVDHFRGTSYADMVLEAFDCLSDERMSEQKSGWMPQQ